MVEEGGEGREQDGGGGGKKMEGEDWKGREVGRGGEQCKKADIQMKC